MTVQPRLRKTRKKPGPPATGKGTPVQVRLQPTLLARLDKFGAAQSDKLSRPEAIRRLLESALVAKSVR
jgi:metal-responsive CopG/Arc/MetJ family transcriptional regulator